MVVLWFAKPGIAGSRKLFLSVCNAFCCLFLFTSSWLNKEMMGIEKVYKALYQNCEFYDPGVGLWLRDGGKILYY